MVGIHGAGALQDAVEFGQVASDFITAQQRVRQLEGEHAYLLMRKARLEAQRDEDDNFIMPMLVGLSSRNVDFNLAYSREKRYLFAADENA